MRNPGPLREMWAACLAAAATAASCNDDFDAAARERLAGLAWNPRVGHELGDALWLENLMQANPAKLG
jgi:hypothetical protein